MYKDLQKKMGFASGFPQVLGDIKNEYKLSKVYSINVPD